MRFIVWLCAAVGVASLAFVCMLKAPLHNPPALASVHAGAMAVATDDLPKRTRFQARDGTWLSYRLYPATSDDTTNVAILVHGSSGSSKNIHMIGKSLSQHGVTAVAIDVRGHGASGTRGDISYLGQLEDDLADLVDELHNAYPKAALSLIGHSSGGGFALRVADSPLGSQFTHFLLLAPYLGYTAPTNIPDNKWVEVSLPRMIAIRNLSLIGIDWPQSIQTIAFANPPHSEKVATSRYTYRLMVDFGPPYYWEEAFRNTPAPITVIAGVNDALMNSPAYKTALEPLGAKVILLDDVDHMSVIYSPSALEAIRASLLTD